MPSSTLLLGHRGSRCLASVRENTLPAFELALQHGCDGFEFDVRLTRDGQAVLCHGAQSHRFSIAKSRRGQLPHLATLEDVLAGFSKRAFLNIELKAPGLAEALLQKLRECPPQRGFVISSFSPDVLIDLRARSDSIPLGIICERRIAQWQSLPVQYLIPNKSLITPNLIKQVHEDGKSLLAWTVNDAPTMLRLAHWGVDGIISDTPELLVATLRGAKPR